MENTNTNVDKYKADASVSKDKRFADQGKKTERKTIRVPVPQGLVSFDHQGQEYTIVDLSMFGIGIAIDSPDIFNIGDILKKAKITFPDAVFSVDVAVIHNTPHANHNFVSGLQIVHTYDSGFIDWTSRVIEEIKSTGLLR